jgi:hypothetical protein
MGGPSYNDQGQLTHFGSTNFSGPNAGKMAPGTQYYQDPMTGKQQSVYFGDSAQDRLKAQTYVAGQGAIGATQQFQNQAQQGANAIGTDFNRFVPQLQTNFAAKPGLDAFSQQLLSQAQQSQNRQLGATQQQIARSVQGPSAGILQSQAAIQSRLNGNPAMFQVAAQQVGRQQQEAQLNNQAALAQQGAYNTGLSASNQAQTLKTGLQGLPVAAQQNLIATLQSQKGK